MIENLFYKWLPKLRKVSLYKILSEKGHQQNPWPPLSSPS